MPTPGVGQVASFLDAMLAGGLEKTLESKLEGLGEDFLMGYLAGPFGMTQRIGQAVQTGGISELQGLGADWLQSLSRQTADRLTAGQLSCQCAAPPHPWRA